MKRIIILIIAASLPLFSAFAQTIKDMGITDYTLELKKDGEFCVDIDLDLTHLNIRNTQVMVLTPCIINGKDTLMLKSIGVYGRNRRIFYERNEKDKPTGTNDIALSSSEANGIIRYSTSVSFQRWMDGCSVKLRRIDYGCCGKSEIVDSTELINRFPLEPYKPDLVYIRPERELVKTREISGSAFIDFPVSQTSIDPQYRNNTLELTKITGTIDSVKNDDDITIKSILIKGYASPESSYENNTFLAKGRTNALKQYVESLYHFGEDFIKTDFEPEDWAGLERYVEMSSLEHKDEILEAIRSDREPDAKELYIKNSWNEEYRLLLEDCYPALRHSDYTIEYEIRSYTDPKEIEAMLATAPQNLSLEEFYILAQTYEPGSEKFNELFETAVRMYPDDPVANLNAANTAISRKDYERALKYLDKAGSLPEAIHTRGVLEEIQDSIRNRYIYKMKKNN